MPDEEYSIALINQWNDESVKMLYKQYYAALATYALHMNVERETAEELIHDLMVKMWNSKPTFENTANLKAYLYNAVRNLCINKLKENKHTEQLEELIQHHAEYHIENQDEEPLFKEEVYRQLALAIEELPKRQKQIFVLQLQGKTNNEIAEALNISYETVRTQKRRGIITLRTKIDKEGLTLLLLLLS